MGIITTIGSLNIDLVVQTPRIPNIGETLAGREFHPFPGGKGANQAIAASRSGAVTKIIGCVGKDVYRPVILGSLNQAGVDTSGVQIISDLPTGVAIVIVEDGGENRIILVAGANAKVTPTLVESQWLSIAQSKMIILQNEIPLETTFNVIQHANLDGIQVLLNASPCYPIPDEILSKINILVVNEVEAAALSGMPVFNQETAFIAAQNLYNVGIKTVIVTLGELGAVFVDGEDHLYQPAFNVKVVDTTAAGDTFVGAYAASVTNGDSPSEALLYATAAAGLSVTGLGAQSSIPLHDEVTSFILNNHPVHDSR